VDGADHIAPDTKDDHGPIWMIEDVGLAANGAEAFGKPSITQREGLVATECSAIGDELHLGV
jgi:hypothetical protein